MKRENLNRIKRYLRIVRYIHLVYPAHLMNHVRQIAVYE